MLDVYVKRVLSLCGITLFVTFKSLFILMNFNAHFYTASRTIEQTWCLFVYPMADEMVCFYRPTHFFKGKALGTRLNLSSLFVALGGGKTHSIAIHLVLQQCCKTSWTFFVVRFTEP